VHFNPGQVLFCFRTASFILKKLTIAAIKQTTDAGGDQLLYKVGNEKREREFDFARICFSFSGHGTKMMIITFLPEFL